MVFYYIWAENRTFSSFVFQLEYSFIFPFIFLINTSYIYLIRNSMDDQFLFGSKTNGLFSFIIFFDFYQFDWIHDIYHTLGYRWSFNVAHHGHCRLSSNCLASLLLSHHLSHGSLWQNISICTYRRNTKKLKKKKKLKRKKRKKKKRSRNLSKYALLTFRQFTYIVDRCRFG